MAAISLANYTSGQQVDLTGASGPPVSGEYVAGQWGLDRDGFIWTCKDPSVPGSGQPGTWINGGRPLLPLLNTSDVIMPKVFKTVTATATGNTALWTPASGKKFRIMRYMIQVTNNAAAGLGGILTVSLKDGVSGDTGMAFDSFVPALAVTTFGSTNSSGPIDLGTGYLSSAADSVLNVNLSTTLTSGRVRVTVMGTEE